jgi:hypothetical protein
MPQSRCTAHWNGTQSFDGTIDEGGHQFGVKDAHRALAFIQAITDASTKRIESGHDAENEIAYATAFCINGLMVN